MVATTDQVIQTILATTEKYLKLKEMKISGKILIEFASMDLTAHVKYVILTIHNLNRLFLPKTKVNNFKIIVNMELKLNNINQK